jgi:hypothetical protein
VARFVDADRAFFVKKTKVQPTGGGMKNSWFKHYNTASQSLTLRKLIDAKDYEAYFAFWTILELVSRWENRDDTPGKITIPCETFSRETNWKPSKSLRVLSRISSVSEIEIREEKDGNLTFLIPNWLKYQETRGGKREAKLEQKVGRSKKREVRSKNIELKQDNAKNQPLVGAELSAAPANKVSEFIAAYVRSFQVRYGNNTRPSFQGKTLGQIKRFLSETPLERAINLIEVYFQMDDPWFKTKAHDFTTFLENQNKIGIALDTGMNPGQFKGIEEIMAERGESL